MGGFGTWPVGEPIPFSLRAEAAQVFAFDAFTQNPDRRFDNPNLLRRGDEIFLIDHETAFSFLYALKVQPQPWRLEQLAFLEQHVFYLGLKGKPVDLARFADALRALSDAKLDSISGEIPEEWKNEKLSNVLSHLKQVRDHADDFVGQVKGRLV